MKLLTLNATAAGLLAVALTGAGCAAIAAEPAQAVAKKPATKATASRAELKTKANQTAVGIQAAQAALTLDELAIAQLIHVGPVACELGVTVNVKADVQMPGYFTIESQKFKFRMTPVVTSTGAIRLQDIHAGAVWLQLANKSMLMSQKLGSRLADVCMNPAQIAVAAAMEKNPPTSLLEPVKVAANVAQPPPPEPDKVSAPALHEPDKTVVPPTTAEKSSVSPPSAIK